MEKKKSIEIVNQLTKYFGLQIIGSQLFVNANLLHEDDTNDIDVAVVRGNERSEAARVFLKDLGFTETEVKGYTESDAYKQVLIRFKFSHPEYDKIIDFNIMDRKVEIYSIPELVKAKFAQKRTDDLKQLLSVITTAGGNPLISLKELIDGTIQ